MSHYLLEIHQSIIHDIDMGCLEPIGPSRALSCFQKRISWSDAARLGECTTVHSGKSELLSNKGCVELYICRALNSSANFDQILHRIE